MDSKTVSQSVDDATKALKSSFSEGSSRLLGSMRDAKRGLLGGLTSTFDHVVNIVGGPDDAAGAAAAPAAATTSKPAPTSGSGGSGQPSKPRPPKPPAPTARRSSDVDYNGSVKQFDDVNNSTTSGGSRMSRQNTAPSGYGGQPSVGGHSEAYGSVGVAQSSAGKNMDTRPPLKRRNTNPFMEGYDPNLVEAEIPPPRIKSAAAADDSAACTVAPVVYQSVEPSRAWESSSYASTHQAPPQIPSGLTSAFLAPSQQHQQHHSAAAAAAVVNIRDRDGVVADCGSGGGTATGRRRRGSGDSDADSEATEGCDESQDADLDEGGLQADVPSKSESQNAESQWNNDTEDLTQLDQATRDCIEFIKYIVQKIFDPTSEITPTDKAKFGELSQQGMGRLWFSKYVSAQRVRNKEVPEEVIFSLVQFFAVVLFECNEAEDYGPATTLMNMAFTFYHEVKETKTQDANIFTKLWSRTQPKPKIYLYSHLTDQRIWQSPRFWNAAFFYAVQHERASKPPATSNTEKQEQIDDVRFQQNITFGQLRTFTSNMRALGVPKDQCIEFIRRQSTIANLTGEQTKILKENMEQWKDESATK